MKLGFKLRSNGRIEAGVSASRSAALRLRDTVESRLSFAMVAGGLVGEGEIDERLAQHRRPVQKSERSDTKGRDCIGETVGPIGLLAVSELRFG
jgi:hypothetical protein